MPLDTRASRYRRLHDQLGVVLKEPHPFTMSLSIWPFRNDRHLKVRITIALDKDIVDYFKAEAEKPGALPYQTQINQALRQAMQSETEGIKDSLLKDPEFIRAVANEINKH